VNCGKGKWHLEVSAKEPVFLNGLKLEFSGYEAKVFDKHIPSAESIHSILLSHF